MSVGVFSGHAQQFMHAIDGMRWQLLQCFLQPRIRFEAVPSSEYMMAVARAPRGEPAKVQLTLPRAIGLICRSNALLSGNRTPLSV